MGAEEIFSASHFIYETKIMMGHMISMYQQGATLILNTCSGSNSY